jgi:spermidine/putrescine transport system ATP-binding protein
MAEQQAAADGVDVRFDKVSKRFGTVVAVDAVSFAIPRGSFHSFLGPSGCGKTTTLRLIAGFEQPDSGEVAIAGQPMVGVPAYRRPVNMVFQHYALFSHMTVAQNVGYGLRQRRPRLDRAEIERRCEAALELVRLPRMGQRRVWELSGGQQQRVALARALINRPTVLLLDEPLAALDRKLRRDMQIELQNLQREVGITFVLVTHDQEEALSMSDSIAIMRDGRIEQFGSPAALYDAPVNRYVADFIGESNFFAGEVAAIADRRATLRTASGLVLSAPASRQGRPLAVGGCGVIAVRPEAIRLWPGAVPESTVVAGLGAPGFCLAGTVRNRIYLGDQTEFSIATGAGGEILVRTAKDDGAGDSGAGELAPGAPVTLGWREASGLSLVDD